MIDFSYWPSDCLSRVIIHIIKEGIGLGKGGSEERNKKDLNNAVENLEDISDQVNKKVDKAQAHLTQRTELGEDIASVTTRTSSSSQQQTGYWRCETENVNKKKI